MNHNISHHHQTTCSIMEDLISPLLLSKVKLSSENTFKNMFFFQVQDSDNYNNHSTDPVEVYKLRLVSIPNEHASNV